MNPGAAPQPTLVFPSTNPDLDGVACAWAYAELLRSSGEDALAWVAGEPDGEARWVLQERDVEISRDPEAIGTAGRFVYVDGSELPGLPEGIDPIAVVEVIDHRRQHRAATDFPNARLQIEAVGAAATLVLERFRETWADPSPESAILLYAAIQSNTQRLNGSVTTERDRRAAAYLETVCEPPRDLIARQMAARRSEILADLRAAVKAQSKTFTAATGAFVVAQLELPGVEVLLRERDFKETLAASLDGPRAMVNIVDSALGRSFLLVPNAEFRDEVAAGVGREFNGQIATMQSAMLRKQIVHALGARAGTE